MRRTGQSTKLGIRKTRFIRAKYCPRLVTLLHKTRTSCLTSYDFSSRPCIQREVLPTQWGQHIPATSFFAHFLPVNFLRNLNIACQESFSEVKMWEVSRTDSPISSGICPKFYASIHHSSGLIRFLLRPLAQQHVYEPTYVANSPGPTQRIGNQLSENSGIEQM